MAGQCVPIQRGGTSQPTAAGARKALGLEVGVNVQPYDTELAAIAAIATPGIVVITGTGTAAARTLTAPAAGFTITNPAGIAGNPTFVLADDLAAYEGLSTTGVVVRTGTGTATTRTLTGTANQIDISNGSGVSGVPTFTLSSTMVAPGTLTVTGAFTSIGIDDNATAERLQIADTIMNVGPGGANGYMIGTAGTAGYLELSSSSTVTTGAHIYLFGSTHATLASNAYYDASTHNFRTAAGGGGITITPSTGAVTAPGTVTGNTVNSTLTMSVGTSLGVGTSLHAGTGISCANSVTAGTTSGGYICKQGSAGGYSNVYNFFWDNSNLQCWVDTTYLGNVSLVSDSRTKKDVKDLGSTWEQVKALRPISYTSKDFSPIASDNTISKMAAAEGKTFSQQKKVERDKAPLIRGSDDLQWGFVAHELQEVLVPTAATGTKDMEDGMQAPQWAPILAAVTKALQEAQVRIEELERIIQSIAGDGQDKDKTWPVM